MSYSYRLLSSLFCTGFGEICLGCSSGSCSCFILHEMEKVNCKKLELGSEFGVFCLFRQVNQVVFLILAVLILKVRR